MPTFGTISPLSAYKAKQSHSCTADGGSSQTGSDTGKRIRGWCSNQSLQADVPGATAHLAVHFSNQRAPSSLESEHFLLILESKYLWEDQDRKRSLIVSKLFSLLFQSTRR
jgi:hypothetical protein